MGADLGGTGVTYVPPHIIFKGIGTPTFRPQHTGVPIIHDSRACRYLNDVFYNIKSVISDHLAVLFLQIFSPQPEPWWGWGDRVGSCGTTGAHAPLPSVPPKNIKKEGEKNDKRKIGGKRKKSTHEWWMLHAIISGRGCSIRASLTCLNFFLNNWEGDTIPSPAQVLRPSFSNFNRSPTYCTITAGRRILHTIISWS